jgi:hypothetical protein
VDRSQRDDVLQPLGLARDVYSSNKGGPKRASSPNPDFSLTSKGNVGFG